MPAPISGKKAATNLKRPLGVSRFADTKTELDLAGRRAIKELEGQDGPPPPQYANPDSEEYRAMVERIRHRLGLTTLHYQQLSDLVKAIGLPKEQLCTYCWDGQE